jgi:signal transduction histidine kinase
MSLNWLKRLPAGGAQQMPADDQPPDHELVRHDDAAAAVRAALPPSRRMRLPALGDWRLRSRLVLIVAIPALAVLVVGGVGVRSSVVSEQGYQKNQQLADLSGDVTSLVQALQDERQDIVTFIAMADQGGRASALSPDPAQRAQAAAVGQQTLVAADARRTGILAARVRTLAATIGTGYSAQAEQHAQGAITVIDNLPALEQAATGSMVPVLTVISYYDATITQLLTLESDVAEGSNNAALADNVRVVSLISNMKEQASEQQAIVTSALPPSQIGANQLGTESLSVLSQEASEQSSNTTSFQLAATPAQRQLYNSALSSPLVATAQQQLGQAESLLTSGITSTSDPTLAVAAQDTSFITSSLGLVERQLMSSIISQSASLRARAAATAVSETIGVLLLLALALLLIVVVGRSMTGPLHRLRSGALYVAGVRLPEIMQRMTEAEGEDVPLDVEPIDVKSADEVGEVARAFDQVHREAVRLAANEAALRGNVNAMFVNLSRRSQSLVQRQIRLITQLEQGEEDSQRLGSLFQMDHLATRMRRNSENLLVLAGQELTRRSSQPVLLVDVLRAALSEIERYERVTVDAQPGIAVRREAVRDVVHLTSELVENATLFSAADTRVTIAGRLLSSGGVLLEITDQGVGMSVEEMARANERLENPPVVDVGVSRHMGLFVVARLGARHKIRVRLTPVPSGGLTAQVWLPDDVIIPEGGIPVRPRAVPNGPENRPIALAIDRSRAISMETAPQLSPIRDVSGEVSVNLPRRVSRRRSDAGEAVSGEQLGAEDLDPPLSEPVAESAETRSATGPLDAMRGQAPATASDAHSEQPVSVPIPTTMSVPVHAERYDRTGPRVDAARAPSADNTDQQTSSYGIRDRRGRSSSLDEVIVPPADNLSEPNRLLVFEAVQSDWFRRGRKTIARPGQGEHGRASAADDGWRAAEVVHAPASDGTTSAGLPKRSRGSNLVPGTAAGSGGPPLRSAGRSATETAARLARFQHGVQQALAATSGDKPDSGEAKSSDGT